MNYSQNNDCSLTFRPIGVIHTELKDKDVGPTRRTNIKSIEIFNQFKDALQGIEEYSNIFVLFWMTKGNVERELNSFPRGNLDYKKVGALAYRGRNHPNPIGLAVCDLVAREENILKVLKLDAYDGTVVIDIKPYDDYDVVPNPSTPKWFKKVRTQD